MDLIMLIKSRHCVENRGKWLWPITGVARNLSSQTSCAASYGIDCIWNGLVVDLMDGASEGVVWNGLVIKEFNWVALFMW